MPKEPTTTAQHEERLEAGWRWLGKHPNRRDWEERYARWRSWLTAYEAHIRDLQRAAQRPEQEELTL